MKWLSFEISCVSFLAVLVGGLWGQPEGATLVGATLVGHLYMPLCGGHLHPLP